jgi:hypothetical protein
VRIRKDDRKSKGGNLTDAGIESKSKSVRTARMHARYCVCNVILTCVTETQGVTAAF